MKRIINWQPVFILIPNFGRKKRAPKGSYFEALSNHPDMMQIDLSQS